MLFQRLFCPSRSPQSQGPAVTLLNNQTTVKSGALVLLRHGESQWNKENRFSGWTDVDLSDSGSAEARAAGRTLKCHGIVPDVAFTSVLKRAIRTLWIVLDEMDLMWIPVHRDWRLNERHYGALQGLNKSETAQRYGEEQVRAWRRSYDIRPPALAPSDPGHPCHDPRYMHLPKRQLPDTESLKDTEARVVPCWHDCVAPLVRGGQTVLIAGHGNSLRALVKHLDRVSDEDIAELNIPTGIPMVYELALNLNPTGHYLLRD